MRYHITSLYESIWDIVEFRAHAPQVSDKDYDSDEAAQIRHSTLKKLLYSSSPYVERSIIRCKD
jgi:hypothetical protein